MRLSKPGDRRASGETGCKQGRDLCLQPGKACHPKPYYILCQAGRDIRGQEAGGVLQSGGLRVPWSQHSGKGNGRVPAAVSLPECGGRLLYGIYQPPGGRRHERIWDSPGYVCRGESYGRRGKGDWHVPAGIQEEEPDAERIRGWILQE